MTTQVLCCCDQEFFLWFVPCPGAPACADTFYATNTEWTTILGKTPAVDDVYKYDSGNREEPCVYCGKFQTAFAGGLNAPGGGFEKQDNCDDTDCPKPLFFFNPCNDACRTYTMAATKTVWDSLLGITIDPNNPSSYAGTWLFTRTDGDVCCQEDDDGNPIEGDPCHKFCGTLSEGSADTSNLCFDSSNANTTPQCEKCTPSSTDIQVIGCSTCNSTSNMSFQLKSNGCGDAACLPCRSQECVQADGSGESRLKYRGRKSIIIDMEIESEKALCITGVSRTQGFGTSSSSFNLLLTIDYTVYMQGNTIKGDANDNPPILSRHTKDPCITIDNITIDPTSTQTHLSEFSTQKLDSFGLPCGSGSVQNNGSNFGRCQIVNPVISIVDTADSAPAICNSHLEKRIGLQEDGIGGNLWYQCEGTPSPNDYICPNDLPTNTCLMNFMTSSGQFGIPIRIQRIDRAEFWFDTPSAGAPSGSNYDILDINVDNVFILKLGVGMIMKDALEKCCCDDIPEFDAMYYNDFCELSSLFAALDWEGQDDTAGLAPQDNQYDRQYKLQPNGERYFADLFDDDNPAFPSSGNPVDWGFGKRVAGFNGTTNGPYLDPDAKLPPWDFNNKRNFACNLVKDNQTFWSFELPSEPQVQEIPVPGDSLGTNERRIPIYDMSIAETIISLECIADNDPNLPSSNCEDGVIDVP